MHQNAFPVFAIFLFAAVILYALFGSPTPDDPGVLEAMIGGLLVLSIGAAGLSRSADLLRERSPYLKALQVFFLTGLVLPSIVGVYFGNDRMLILRDLLAFAFLGLPLFLSERFVNREKFATILSYLLVAAGIAFCFRTLMPVFNVWIPQGELLYLSNSPLALFAAVFLAGMFWNVLVALPGRTAFMQMIGTLTGLAILTGAMLLDVQRATVGAVFITLFILGLFDFVRAPKKTILPLIIGGALLLILLPLIGEAVYAIARKTADVGMNARVQEAQAVYAALASEPVTLFVGKGWGAVFASPAVAGLEVNYTHSLLTTMALKGGMVMFILSALVVLGALHQIFLIFQWDKVKGFALFWPLVIPAFLYASHKSLDFGLILLLIGVWSIRPRLLQESHTSCKQEEQSNEPKTGL